VRAGGNGDEPDEREPDTDQHPGQHADQQRRDDRRDGDPEVEPRHPGQPAHLGHVQATPVRAPL
jgi:hypothetical protein